MPGGLVRIGIPGGNFGFLRALAGQSRQKRGGRGRCTAVSRGAGVAVEVRPKSRALGTLSLPGVSNTRAIALNERVGQ